MPKLAFVEAAEAFVELVDQVPDHAWEQPGLGEWTVRELVAHALRALTTVEQALEPSGPARVLTGPDEYFRFVLRAPAVHAGVADRAKADAAHLGNPSLVVRATAARAIALVQATPDDTTCSRNGWSMPLIDYLPTRVVELVVHSLDLADAISVRFEPPPWPAELSLQILVGLADRATGGRGALLRGLAGRGPLPPGFSVLG